MNALARFVTQKTRAVVLVALCLMLALAGLWAARQVENEDDVLAFLPKSNPEVRLFHEINARFGGLDLALVGLTSDDVFTADFLKRLRKATRELKETRGLDHVLTLANVMDFTPDREKGGIITDRLVNSIPKNSNEKEALRKKVLSRDLVVGNFVSRGGDAVLLYCYLAYGSDPKAMAKQIRRVVSDTFPNEEKYWGGGPFVSTYIYNTTQQDMQRLTPWAVLAIVVLMMVAFRDVLGSCLALLSTGMGIVMSLGAMAALGIKFNIVLGAMPVILFAVGSAYGIHVLARYYTLSQTMPVREAVAATITGVGPTVLAAGLTTAASLLSFVWMDIRPLRTFGIFTALGILCTLVLSLTFIPAVVMLSGIKRKPRSGSGWFARVLVNLTLFARRQRIPVAVGLGLVAAAGVVLSARVDTRMDQSTFFSKNSPPDRAERFLGEHFGGAQFVQLYFQGDMNDPAVLREMRGLGDAIAALPHVSSVQHLGVALGQVNKILVGQQRIPDTSAQVRTLFSFLAGDPAAAQLVSSDRKRALMHVKVDSNRAAVLEPLIRTMEDLAKSNFIHKFQRVSAKSTEGRARIEALVLRRAQALAKLHKVDLGPKPAERLQAGLTTTQVTVKPATIAAEIVRFLNSEECVAELPDALEDGRKPDVVVAEAVAALGPRPTEGTLTATIAKVTGRAEDDELVDDLTLSLESPLDEFWRIAATTGQARAVIEGAKLSVPAERKARFEEGLATALMDRGVADALVAFTDDAPTAASAANASAESGSDDDETTLAATGANRVAVNGLPVMHRGLSRSVTANQARSLAFALALVLVIMTVLFRSLWSGLLVSLPTLITLLVIYGGMGLLGVHLDIGTSMLASIILGAGVDYAVHLAAAWQAPPHGTAEQAAATAAEHSGPAIWTNAIMVAAGFFVLTLGDAKPLQNVGGLTAAAMFTAAMTTFLAFPALARKLRYRKEALPETTDQAPEQALNKPVRG